MNGKMHFDSHSHFQVPEGLLIFPIMHLVHEIRLVGLL